MARIPTGNFGNALPGRVPQVQSSPGTFGAGTARAVERLGATGAQIGIQQEADETRERNAELQRQQQVFEATERAREGLALQQTGDKLTDLADEISEGVRTGAVPMDKAQETWQQRSREAIDGALPQFSEFNRQTVLPRLMGQADRLGNGVRRNVEKRGREEVTGSITQSLEHLQREYRNDPAAATAQAMSTIDSLAPFSTMTPDQVAKLKQGWKENTQFTAGFEMVSSARTDRKALDAAEKRIGELPDLDPQRRAQLVDKIGAYRMAIDQKAEIAAARAQRQSEAAMNRAEGVFTAASALADKGVLAPAYADQVLNQLAGTPYQDAFRQLAVAQYEAGPLAAKPVTAQRAELDAVNAAIAQNGLTPQLDKRRNQVQAVVRGSEEDLKRDPLRAGLERGVITEIAPLDVSSPQAVAATAAARLQQSQVVSTWAGRPVSPLTEQEAGSVKAMLDTLPVKERSAAVATLAQTLGPQAAAGLARQMDDKDKSLALAFAYAGSKTTAGRFTSELLLRGAQAKKDGTSTKGEKAPDVKAAGWRSFAASELDGVFANAQTSESIRDAAELIMHGMASENSGRLTARDMERAVTLAAGGKVVEHNGRKVPLPAEMDEDAFGQRLRAVGVAEIGQQAPGGTVRAGGVDMPVAEFVKSIPGQQLMPVKPGQFAVLVGGRPVVNAQGAPIIVKVQ